jgi:hypothetical protein
MPFKHVARASRAVLVGGKYGSMRAEDDDHMLKPRTLHAATRR